MKYPLTVFGCLAATFFARAQNAPQTGVHAIGKDSINLSLNDHYNLVDDSCATIIRHARYNFTTHKFTGKFTDVGRANPAHILAEGNYTANGLKDGDFVAYFPNGHVQSKGTYKNDKYTGKWEVGFRNGNPELNFEVDDAGNIKIMNAWNNKGVKEIDNGSGDYQVNMGSIIWHGKLKDGLPDGSWTATSKADPRTVLITENFKKGKFQKGKSQAGEYTDASRMVLIDPNILPYTIAEQMVVSPNGCEVVVRQQQPKERIVNAKFAISASDFNQRFKESVNPYLAKANVLKYEDDVVFEGVISAEGIPGNFQCKTMFDDNVARNIISGLTRLPAFEPATINGKPVPQGFRVTFTFHNGLYHFSYKFLPLE